MNKVLKIKVRSIKAFDVKADTQQGVVEAYVSIFGNVDSYGEVVDKGAFAESLATKLPKVVWSHDWQQPIGVVNAAREDEKGLYVKFTLVKGVQKADEALALMQAQGGDGRPAIDEFSIGYSVQQDEIGNDGFRHLKKIRLYEISPVLVGANSETELLSVKGVKAEDLDDGTTPHVVTQEDLDNNPALVEAGVAVGDTIGLPKEDAPAPAEEPKPENEPAPAPAADEEAKAAKEGRTLSAKTRAAIEQVVGEAEQFGNSLKTLVTPLKELLDATDPAKAGGQKVEPTSADTAKVLRIRQAVKQADRALEYVLRISK